MRRSTLLMLKRGLVLLLGFTLIACGEKESAQVEATPREAAPKSEEAKAPEPAKAAPTYVPPEALSPKESRKAYPWGKRKAAKRRTPRRSKEAGGRARGLQRGIDPLSGLRGRAFNLACECAIRQG